MNGCCLQSITTPKKACKVVALASFGRLCARNGDTDPTLYGGLGRAMIRWSVWVEDVWTYGIVKHGGVTPTNLGKSRPLF
ncbi:unnamed protein product [Prunus brigantina]